MVCSLLALLSYHFGVLFSSLPVTYLLCLNITDNFFRLSSSPYASDLARHTSVHPVGKQRIKLRKTKVRNPSARIQRAVFFRHALPQQKAANQSMKAKVQPSRRDSTHRRLPAHSPLVENAESIQRNEGAQTIRKIQPAVFFQRALPQQKAGNQSMKAKMQPSRRDSTHRRLPAHSTLVENAESIQRNEGAQTIRKIQPAVFFQRALPRQKTANQSMKAKVRRSLVRIHWVIFALYALPRPIKSKFDQRGRAFSPVCNFHRKISKIDFCKAIKSRSTRDTLR